MSPQRASDGRFQSRPTESENQAAGGYAPVVNMEFDIGPDMQARPIRLQYLKSANGREMWNIYRQDDDANSAGRINEITELSIENLRSIADCIEIWEKM